MKEELEKLGFDYINRRYWLKRQNTYSYIVADESGDIFIYDCGVEIFLLEYNYKKLKQLIKILS